MAAQKASAPRAHLRRWLARSSSTVRAEEIFVRDDVSDMRTDAAPQCMDQTRRGRRTTYRHGHGKLHSWYEALVCLPPRKHRPHALKQHRFPGLEPMLRSGQTRSGRMRSVEKWPGIFMPRDHLLKAFAASWRGHQSTQSPMDARSARRPRDQCFDRIPLSSLHAPFRIDHSFNFVRDMLAGMG
jgi:hypothetical protein